MAKMWCEKCEGTGRVHTPNAKIGGYDDWLCPYCDGRCYTDEAVVKVSEVREMMLNILAKPHVAEVQTALNVIEDWLDHKEQEAKHD